MEPLTPNTSAFLSYLSANLGNENDNANTGAFDQNAFNGFNFDSLPAFDASNAPKVKTQPASLPPSAFFPVPGRDTPEDTPPSTNEASQSPEKVLAKAGTVQHDSEDSDRDAQGDRRASINHKRKAGLAIQANRHVEEEDDDEEDDSDLADGHEDKRVHQNGRTPGGSKKGGRKSVGGDDPKAPKETKAARRKEQNRAAQKAFRERREAKVKDLEDKVAELERKSFGTSVENENLRGILKRLQEENVALRQAAFTFSMPVNGSPPSATGTGSNTPQAGKQRPQQAKPLSPPHINSDDVLRSINDIQAGPSRKPSNGVTQSPASIASGDTGNISAGGSRGSSQSPLNLFQDPSLGFDATIFANARPNLPTSQSSASNTTASSGLRSDSGISPASTTSNGQTELDALWASFLSQGAPQKDKTSAWNVNAPNFMGSLDAQTNGMSFAGNDAKVGGGANSWDKFAFRDTSVPQPLAQSRLPEPQQQQNVQPTPAVQSDPWSGMMDNNMDDFLASLTGANDGNLENEGVNDDDFNAQLQQILGANNLSPSNAFELPGANPFSPTNYLNMSPSPLVSASASTEPSPQTHSGSSASTSTSPESIAGYSDQNGANGQGPVEAGNSPLYVVDDSGKVIKPSELWLKMGMQHDSDLEHLLIDDLCDMMRSKATCKDGKKTIKASEAEHLFRYKSTDPVHTARMRDLEQRAGVQPGSFSGTE